MKYDFDTVVDRGGNRSAKYDERTKKFGTDQVIPLWIADMDFKTAQPIIDALKARAEEGIWGYTSRPDSYFEAIRGWQKRRNGWDIDPSLMSFSLGVVQSISAMVKLFTPEGGSVLIQTPVYSEFYDMTEAWNRRVLENPFVEKDGRWEMDWADFEAKLAEADLFLLCSPHNPLGIVWTPEELRRMVELCIKHRVVLFSDEIHSDLIFHGKRHTPTASVSDEAARYANDIILYHAACVVTIWPLSFTLPNTLRAAADVKVTMVLSIISMWVFRFGFSYLLTMVFHMGIFGVWVAMTIDWLVRGIFFVCRYKSGRWQKIIFS